jgi:hypothetical protein
MCVSSTLSGGDVEPLHELKCEAETHKEWGAMIFACIVVNLCTLIGLLTFVPGIKGLMENEATRAAWLSGSSSFAAGALLAAAAFLMIPECTPARPPSAVFIDLPFRACLPWRRTPSNSAACRQ